MPSSSCSPSAASQAPRKSRALLHASVHGRQRCRCAFPDRPGKHADGRSPARHASSWRVNSEQFMSCPHSVHVPELTSQPADSLIHVGARCGLAPTHRACNVCVATAEQFPLHERRSLTTRQARNSLTIHVGDCVRGVARRRSPRFRDINDKRNFLAPARGSPLVQEDVGRDSIQPGPVARRRPESTESRKGPEKRLLKEVLCLGAVVRETAQIAQHLRLMGIDHVAKRPDGTCPSTTTQTPAAAECEIVRGPTRMLR